MNYLGLLFIGLALAFFCWITFELNSGKAYGKWFRVYKKDERPGLYWITVGIQILGALFLAGYGI